MKRRIHTKKVLVAAIGIATVSYAAACLDGTESSGNLLPPPDAASDTREDVSSSGNLVAPPIDATSDVSVDANADVSSSGNLLPPPTDAGDGGG